MSSETLARVLFDENGNAVKVTQDGSDYKYEFIGKLRNAAGTIFNPATEETLSAADTKLGTIDGVLDSIKDTDGIKKITDELPAGTQEIGSVAQGTAADDDAAWPVKQVTADGEAYKVYDKGNEYIPAAESLTSISLLQDIKTELRLMNMHLQQLTELDLEEDDLEEEGLL